MMTFYYRFIDSQVFAEEVEPTGAVPIEMSLERYRYAALPNKFKEMSDDLRLQPRVMLKFFSGSHILGQVNKRDYIILYPKIPNLEINTVFYVCTHIGQNAPATRVEPVVWQCKTMLEIDIQSIY